MKAFEWGNSNINWNNLLLENYQYIPEMKNIKDFIDGWAAFSIAKYREVLTNGILNITPIYYNSKLIVANAKLYEFNDYNVEIYISEICKVYGFSGVAIKDKQEKYDFLNKLLAIVYDDFYKECDGKWDEVLIGLLSILEYNRYLMNGLALSLVDQETFSLENDLLMSKILQTLDMYKILPEEMQCQFIRFEELYFMLENMLALDKRSIEYGIESLEYKRCKGEKLIINKEVRLEKIIQIMRGMTLLNVWKVEFTEGRYKDTKLKFDKEGKVVFDKKIADYPVNYVQSVSDIEMEEYEKYDTKINHILEVEKGFSLIDIKEIIHGIKIRCGIGDEFLIGDEYQWISAIKNCCKCSEEIASRILREFIYFVDQDKMFTNKTKYDNRAMKKCIFLFGNKYISIVNLFSLSLVTWLNGIYTGEMDDEKIKRKLQEIYEQIDNDFEKQVCALLKNELSIETIRWNIHERDILFNREVIVLPGQIDVLLYINKKIFVIECKNIGLKSDPTASSNEYKRLTKLSKKSFQGKLDKKVKKVEENKMAILNYLALSEEDVSQIEVVGVIVIKSFSDATLIETNSYDVVLVSNIVEWIKNKAFVE